MPGRESLFAHSRILKPIGRVTVIGSERGLRRILLGEDAPRGCRPGARRRFEPVFAALQAILAGRRPTERIRLDLEPLSAFTAAVLERIRSIPRGRTMTYGEVARVLGRPGAGRAVGQALGRNPIPILLPCQRVVAATGLGGFSAGLKLKRRLLALERGRGNAPKIRRRRGTETDLGACPPR